MKYKKILNSLMIKIKMVCVYSPGDGIVAQSLQALRPSAPIPLLRTQLYFGVCVLIRLAFANFAFAFRNEKWVPFLVGFFAAMSVIQLAPSVVDPGRQWWSKRFQLGVAVLLVLACVGTHFRLVPSIVVPVLLWASVIGGLVRRWVCCCR